MCFCCCYRLLYTLTCLNNGVIDNTVLKKTATGTFIFFFLEKSATDLKALKLNLQSSSENANMYRSSIYVALVEKQVLKCNRSLVYHTFRGLRTYMYTTLIKKKQRLPVAKYICYKQI